MVADSGQDRDPLEELAAEFMDRRRRGEAPSISGYAKMHPELAEEIHDLFPTIAAMEEAKESGATERAKGTGIGHGERIGDFHIIREIGRGGMGVVYEAEQESLGRRVAIKVLPRQMQLDATHVRRFEREAQVAARMHHNNIVPVFGFGEQDGYQYYVMQYIRGVGLNEIVDHLADADMGAEEAPDESDISALVQQLMAERDKRMQRLPNGDNVTAEQGRRARADMPTIIRDDGTTSVRRSDGDAESVAGPPERSPRDRAQTLQRNWRGCGFLMAQVARALEYAHSQGALHRDIKPANILIDAQGVAWITDFGLAKATHTEDLTMTGDMPGTLRYMAPEQFSGQADSRTDVYSLGVTMYEFLTLEPAFKAATATTLIRSIANGDAPRPRKLCPVMPLDLETIVLKAMARDPSHRYESAGALARDLERFVADRPIRARRVSAGEHVWRWARRNPVAASLASLTLLLVLTVIAVTTIAYVRTSRALDGQAAQRRRAEESADLALDVLDRIFDRFYRRRVASVSQFSVGDDNGSTIDLPTSSELSRTTAALLEDMLPFYERLAKQSPQESRLLRKTAEASLRVGSIRMRLGQYEAAAKAYAQASKAYRRLVTRVGNPVAMQVALAHTQNELGQLYRQAGMSERSHDAHAEAQGILETLARGHGASLELRYELARTYYFLGVRPMPDPGTPPGGGRGQRRPGDMEDGPLSSRPPMDPPGLDPGVGGPEGHHGPPPDHMLPGPPNAEAPTGGQPLAGGDADYLGQAIDILTDLRKQDSDNPGYRYLLALCYRERRSPGAPKAGVVGDEAAVKILEGLVRDFPDVPDYCYELVETYARVYRRGELSDLGFASMEQSLRKALALSEKLVAHHSDVPLYLESQAHVLLRLGDTLRRSGKLSDAEAANRQGLALQTRLVNELTDGAGQRRWLAEFHCSLARVLGERRKYDEARVQMEAAVKLLSALRKDAPEMRFIDEQLARAYMDFAGTLRRMGEVRLAREARQKAEELMLPGARREAPPRR